MEMIRVSEGNTNDTLAHDDGGRKTALRLYKGNTKCDSKRRLSKLNTEFGSKTSIKTEPEVLDIEIGQAERRGDMDHNSIR